jgi:hypothetical protein
MTIQLATILACTLLTVSAAGSVLRHAGHPFSLTMQPPVLMAIVHGCNTLATTEECADERLAKHAASAKIDAQASASKTSGFTPADLLDRHFYRAQLASLDRKVRAVWKEVLEPHVREWAQATYRSAKSHGLGPKQDIGSTDHPANKGGEAAQPDHQVRVPA